MKKEEELEKILKHLAGAKFNEIWRGIDLKYFYEFLVTQGVPAKGFLVTFPMKGGSLAWFFYPIEGVKMEGDKARL